MFNKNSLNYKDSGVDINKSNHFINVIKKITHNSQRQEVLGDLGGFSGLCSLPIKYKNPVLVSSTDGVGTKLRLAIDFNRHNDIGIDLVAMCVNDIIVYGAEPLFFLDYYATSKLDIKIATQIIQGITRGCIESNCTLIGGETAEMPGFYNKKDYDLAGFCLGVVEKSNIIDGSKIKNNDILIALGSSGPHSNGYSLINQILRIKNINILDENFKNKKLIDYLLEPTRIYVKNIINLINNIEVHGIVHLTGGSFFENIPRILPEKSNAVIEASSWKLPEIFSWLQNQGNINTDEMYHTFNCGVGMIIIVNHLDVNKTLKIMNQNGEKAWVIGEITSRNLISNERVIMNL